MLAIPPLDCFLLSPLLVPALMLRFCGHVDGNASFMLLLCYFCTYSLVSTSCFLIPPPIFLTLVRGAQPFPSVANSFIGNTDGEFIYNPIHHRLFLSHKLNVTADQGRNTGLPINGQYDSCVELCQPRRHPFPAVRSNPNDENSEKGPIPAATVSPPLLIKTLPISLLVANVSRGTE